MQTETKLCSKCNRECQRTDFYSKVDSADGLQSYCKDCFKKRKSSIEGKNEPARRKNWGRDMFKYLDVDESEY